MTESCRQHASAADHLLKIRLVAAHLGVSERTVWRLIAAGELPRPVQGLGGPRLPESELAAYVEKLKRERVPEEQETLRDAENPIHRALIVAFKESPALLGMVAKIAGRTLTQDQIAQMQESTREQLRWGKERQRPRKGRPGSVITVNTL